VGRLLEGYPGRARLAGNRPREYAVPVKLPQLLAGRIYCALAPTSSVGAFFRT
jgi:hypothetical protein